MEETVNELRSKCAKCTNKCIQIWWNYKNTKCEDFQIPCIIKQPGQIVHWRVVECHSMAFVFKILLLMSSVMLMFVLGKNITMFSS